MPQAPRDIYTEALPVYGHGFPVWEPDPSNNSIAAYLSEGVAIGDVGIKTDEHDLDYLFNITVPRTNAKNQPHGTPNGFRHLDTRRDDKQTNPHYLDPWTYVGEHSVKEFKIDLGASVTLPSGLNIPGGNVEFSWSSEKGAILILPRGASREKLWDNDRFKNYARQNALEWFKYAGRRRHWEPNGETSKTLYVTTGCVKTSAWAMATVSNNSGAASLTLSAAAPVIQGSVSCSYQWQRHSPAFVHSGPRYPSDRENQCFFVSGFSIKLRKGVGFAGLGGKIKVNIADVTGAETRKFSDKGAGGLTQSRGGNSSGNLASGGRGPNRESIGDSAEQTHDYNDDMEVEALVDSPKPFNASDVICNFLLDEMPDAHIAITHDDEWCALLEEVDHAMLDEDELLRRTRNRYRPHLESGFAWLVAQRVPQTEGLISSHDVTLSVPERLPDRRAQETDHTHKHPATSKATLEMKNSPKEQGSIHPIGLAVFEKGTGPEIYHLTAEDEKPFGDLRGQVVKTEDHYFAYGDFSEIYKGVWTDPLTGDVTKVAIKLLRGVHTDATVLAHTIRRLNRETRVWHSLSHTNVMPFLGLCSGIGPSPAMISPLCDNGDVHRYLVSNPQANRLEIIIGVAHGLQYLHSVNVVHGDLKGRKVLMDDNGTPRLSGFGRSKLIDHRGFTTLFSGSSRYMAPELTIAESDVNYDDDDDPMNDVPPNLTKETDVFAFSMVALEILTGKLPFFYIRQDTTVLAFIQEGKRPERSRCLPTIFTDTMWELLVNCWDRDPGQRLDMGTVVQRLEQM